MNVNDDTRALLTLNSATELTDKPDILNLSFDRPTCVELFVFVCHLEFRDISEESNRETALIR